MIPFDLRYLRVDSAEDAVAAWGSAVGRGETAHYLGGGTEIITLARESKLTTDVVIELAGIPEATSVETVSEHGGDLPAFGSALRLNTIVDGDYHGLLQACLAGIADRTTRNSITLGGNICGMLPYREAVLPFLLAEGQVETVSTKGRVLHPVTKLFDKRLNLAAGEMALRFLLPPEWAAPGTGTQRADPDALYGPRTIAGTNWFYQRRVRDPRVDYPLVTLAMARVGGELRVALSGAWGYPARAVALEAAIEGAGGAEAFVGEANGGAEDRMTQSQTTNTGLARSIGDALDTEGRSFRADHRGSAAYRRELAVLAIGDGLAHITARNGAER